MPSPFHIRDKYSLRKLAGIEAGQTQEPANFAVQDVRFRVQQCRSRLEHVRVEVHPYPFFRPIEEIEQTARMVSLATIPCSEQSRVVIGRLSEIRPDSRVDT